MYVNLLKISVISVGQTHANELILKIYFRFSYLFSLYFCL